ncbi:UNVERIFIED_CONTAM: Cyclin-A2-1 [Sesamum radiatum]|uniref:Cyclin-A2-1 n=1 Tax=Sesamum radiatum TaxID=300843 RepID=A0AAW2MHH5_SESRA
MKHAVMNDENRTSNFTKPTVRITRARARVLRPSNGLPPLYLQQNRMTDGSCEQTPKEQHQIITKQQRVQLLVLSIREGLFLKIFGDSSLISNLLYLLILPLDSNSRFSFLCAQTHCIWDVVGCQPSKQDRKGSLQKKGMVEPPCVVRNTKVSGDRSESIMEERNRVRVKETQEISSPTSSAIEPTEFINGKISGEAGLIPLLSDSSTHVPLISASDRADHAEDGKPCVKQEHLDDRSITDIDSKHKDPQMCSLYAADIYSNLYARQVDRRPFANYMEKLQQDITQGMRGILIDWLVEVSEEYRLVPDTLYLTVNLIDRFLSENYIEKQKLQLLGVTCMLIASKYEEICAPRVEEFCFITDNTYTKEEDMFKLFTVLICGDMAGGENGKSHSELFGFSIVCSHHKEVPQVPSVELEFLANYLAELTLIEYSFLKFLPSLVAASAVFLARWTLDQSEHPWNPTLEHYTRYKTSDLKTAVLQLQDLQLNTSRCVLNAIREKYKQPKFKCVSTLSSPKPVQSLF